jgi:predicted patatin/cPLA2 family phospholipase
MKLFLHKYKGLVKAMSVRHEMYNSQKKYVFTREKEGLAFVIAPEMPLPAGRIEHDKEKLQQAYDIGRSTALSSLDALRSFIEK